MFCIAALDGPAKVSFKVRDEEFGPLCETPDIRPADYVARYKWVTVGDFARFSESEWRHYIDQSYGLIAAKLPRKLRESLG
jgi:predicted DNA-binding protein (MmcQ/YjbR family)